MREATHGGSRQAAALTVLFPRAILDGIAAGRIDLAFRCWRRPTVRPGGTLRTAVGVLAIAAVEPVDDAAITAAAARRAGFASRAAGGAWTDAVLRLIAAHPGVRAADLAARRGVATPEFKRDVRKLKELGLTESLEVGYRLSPRGRSLLRGARPKG